MEKPRILITNDDGVFAPGIAHLWNAVQDIADVTVVAPSEEQSASGLSITLRRPLKIDQVNWPNCNASTWSVSGTPSDCVKLALNVILKEPPHLILSGINRGTNAGRNVLYSGTVAGVIEGALRGIPGIAFSSSDFTDPDFKKIESYIPPIMEYVLKHPLPPGTFLNVNFPSKHVHAIQGIRMTRQGKEYWMEDPQCRIDPLGENYYWLGSKLAKFLEEENSDIAWLQKGYATVVPIHVGQMTDAEHVKQHKKVFEEFVNASR